MPFDLPQPTDVDYDEVEAEGFPSDNLGLTPHTPNPTEATETATPSLPPPQYVEEKSVDRDEDGSNEDGLDEEYNLTLPPYVAPPPPQILSPPAPSMLMTEVQESREHFSHEREECGEFPTLPFDPTNVAPDGVEDEEPALSLQPPPPPLLPQKSSEEGSGSPDEEDNSDGEYRSNEGDSHVKYSLDKEEPDPSLRLLVSRSPLHFYYH